MNKRNTCEICGKKNLELFYSIKNFPVRMGVSGNTTGYKYVDLNYGECNYCKNVQILQLPSIYDVYEANHNINVIGKKWKDHNGKLSEFILKLLPKQSTILEIGDPRAKIASLAIHKDMIKRWDIVEPNAEPVSLPKIRFINSFFDKNFTTKSKYDALIMSHVFEHLIGVKTLLQVMYKALKSKSLIIISVPNLRDILNQGSMSPAGLHFEHTFYFNKEILIQLFHNHGFKLVKYKPFQDHSEFFCFTKATLHRKSYKDLNQDNPKDKILSTFKAKKAKLHSFNRKISNGSYDGKFVFGAHIQTQMFTSMGLKEESLTGVLDNDSSKHNKYVYGTKLKVLPVQEIAKYHNPILFCDMGPYTVEITKQVKTVNPKAEIV